MHFYKRYRPELIGAILCFTLGMIAGYSVSVSDSSWYLSLDKPTFNPPSWIFGPVWSVLYLMMGIALGKIWKARAAYRWPLMIFILKFVFNLAWSPLFFYCQRVDLALIDISLLWICLVALIVITYYNKNIFLLLLPYLMWVSFAWILNYNIYLLNGAAG